MEEEIDFLICWVNDQDEEWKALRSKYEECNAEDARKQRFRDWDILRYWFRGVELFAPWVRKIHFITSGHLPTWLNLSHPKLHIVTHEEFVPKEYLPTFNANTIELNFHHIKGLSEHFVYFNDDMFLLRPVLPKDFFLAGKPVDMLALQPIVVKPENPIMAYIFLNNTSLITKHFSKREAAKAHPGHFFNLRYPLLYFCYNIMEMAFPLFTGFYTVHGAAPLCKNMYEQIWEQEFETLHNTCLHKFRNKQDVNQYLIREWKKLSGEFVPKNMKKEVGYYEIESTNEALLQAIKKQRWKQICVNDTKENLPVEEISKHLIAAFETILPAPSKFECPITEE